MDESAFLEALFLRIKAAEPVIFVQTSDDDWIVDALKRMPPSYGGTCSFVDTPDWDAKETPIRSVCVWLNASCGDLVSAEKKLRSFARRLRSSRTIVIIVPPYVERPDCLDTVPVLSAPLPGREARSSIAKLVLGTYACDLQRIEAIANASAGLSRTQIHRVLARCVVEARDDKAFDAWQARIVAEKKQLLSDNLSLDVIDDKTSMDDVGGLDELKLWLSMRSAAFTDRARAFGLMPPRGVLLVGIQGCGKSLVAKAIANTWNFPLLQLDMTAIFASSDSPDAVLRQALHVADAMSPAVIWCDEIEKAFEEGADAATRRLLGHILNWLQERRSSAFFVATANDVRKLPAELMRKGRFDELFFLDLPDEKSRADIFAIHLRKRGRDPKNFDLKKLAAEARNFSGAEIEQTVVAGLFAAFDAKHELSTDDLLDAVHDIVPLYKQREDEVKKLREWASERTRQAANNARYLSYFS